MIKYKNGRSQSGGRFDSAGRNTGRSLWSCPPQTSRRGVASRGGFLFSRAGRRRYDRTVFAVEFRDELSRYYSRARKNLAR
jgi:hypothetical protein